MPVNVGVVGLGHWGSNHVRVVSAARDVDRVYLHDISTSRVEAAAAIHGATAVYDLDDFFDRCDAVVIATHPSTHGQLAERALAHGCHLLVEKPLALSSTDVRRVSEAAVQAGRVLMVGHTFAYHPAVEELARMVSAGELGPVRHLESRRLNLGLYRSDCDVLWDLAPHDLSIFGAVMGAPPSSVLVRGGGGLGAGATDTAHLHLTYPGGVSGVVALSWRWPTKVRQTTVVGEQGMAVFDDTDRAAPLKVYDMGVSLPQQGDSGAFVYRDGGMRNRSVLDREPLSLEIEHFIECVSRGTAPRTGASEAAVVVQTLEAASTSLRERREVHLTELHTAGSEECRLAVPHGVR